MSRELTAAEVRRAVRAYTERGLSIRVIASDMGGVSYQRVRGALIGAGVQLRGKGGKRSSTVLAQRAARG